MNCRFIFMKCAMCIPQQWQAEGNSIVCTPITCLANYKQASITGLLIKQKAYPQLPNKMKHPNYRINLINTIILISRYICLFLLHNSYKCERTTQGSANLPDPGSSGGFEYILLVYGVLLNILAWVVHMSSIEWRKKKTGAGFIWRLVDGIYLVGGWWNWWNWDEEWLHSSMVSISMSI